MAAIDVDYTAIAHEDAAKVRGVITAMEEKSIPNILDTLIDRWFTNAFLVVFRVYVCTEGPWLHQITAPMPGADR